MKEDTSTLSIRQLQSKSSLRVLCHVAGKPVQAVVDTAADATIISEKLFTSLPHQPTVKREVTMLAAGENQTFKAKQVGPISLRIGKSTMDVDIFVAPILDNMLLGMDLLERLQAKVDIGRKTMVCTDELLPLSQESKHWDPGKQGSVELRLKGKVKIPPYSETVLPVDMECSTNSERFWLEPSTELSVHIAKAVYANTTRPSVCIINGEHKTITIPQGTLMGVLHPLGPSPSHHYHIQPRICQTRLNHKPTNQKEMPDSLKEILEKASNELNVQEQERLKAILLEYQDIFATSSLDLGNFSAVQHTIDTGDATPVKLGLRRTPVHYVKEENELLNNMLLAGVIQPSMSSWAAAPVLVRKKDGGVRWCIDYRALNQRTKKDVFPLPSMSECIDSLDKNVWFSKLDANSAYWQIPMHPDSKEKTAFRTRQGLFEFNKLPFGLSNSPSSFSRAMSLVLTGLSWNTVLCFIDDICVLGKSTDEHFANLTEVFSRFREYQLKLKPSKCTLFKKEVEFLGRKVGTNGVALTDHSVSVIKEWKTPSSVKEVEKFLGLANYHRSFMKDYAHTAEPLQKIVGKKEFLWGKEQEQAFEELKNKLASSDVLAIPNLDGEFILDTDASDFAIGAELLQIQEGTERVIAYASYSLTPQQRKYCTTRKELLAVVRFTNHFRHYLLGKKFTVRTDHNSLVWLMNFKNVEGQLARWLEELSRFSMKIIHRAGKKHDNADALSRRPVEDRCLHYTSQANLATLPCRGCNYCQRHQRNWGEFEEQVDNITGLSTDTPTIRTITIPEGEEAHTQVSSIDVVFFGTPKICHITQTPSGNSQPTSSTHLDPDLMKTSQETDNKLRFLWGWLKRGETPDPATLMLAGIEEKFYWTNKELFVLHDGIIYKNDDTRLLVIPESLKNEVLYLCHDIPSAAHQGIKRTLSKITSRYFWYRVSKDVKNHVLGCQQCNKNKHSRRDKFPLTMNHAGIPMEKIHIDFIGPLPKTKEGNEHILVMVDQFTKWTEAIPLPCQEAEVTAKAAVTQFFCRFGFPLQIVADQGRNFESKLFKEICKMLHIHKLRTTAYRPSANGQAERQNRTLAAAIRCFVNSKQDDWDEFLPLITAAIRSSVNRQTGFTPNRLMLGREVITPIELAIPQPSAETTLVGTYAQKLEKGLQEAHQVARDTLNLQLKRMKRNYDVKSSVRTLRKGDVIYYFDKGVRGQGSKFKSPWVGPAIITEVLSPSTFRVCFNNCNEKVINHDNLKLCTDNQASIPAWIKNKQRVIRDGVVELFCICKQPDDGSLFVQCNTCLDWFHGRCMHISQSRANRLKVYICPNCTTH